MFSEKFPKLKRFLTVLVTGEDREEFVQKKEDVTEPENTVIIPEHEYTHTVHPVEIGAQESIIPVVTDWEDEILPEASLQASDESIEPGTSMSDWLTESHNPVDYEEVMPEIEESPRDDISEDTSPEVGESGSDTDFSNESMSGTSELLLDQMDDTLPRDVSEHPEPAPHESPIISETVDRDIQDQGSLTEDIVDNDLTGPVIPLDTFSRLDDEESPGERKNATFVSLRDVLRERGNFWEEKIVEKKEKQSSISGAPEEEDHAVPEEIVMPVTEPASTITLGDEKSASSKGVADTLLLGISLDGTESITVDNLSLRRHMLIMGRTGSGKSTLMERMILQDIDAGRGVGLIDPHGDLYDRIARQIPRSRSNEVILFDLADRDYPIGFNILENTHEQFSSLIASSIVGVFKKIFGYSWGPRLEYILRNTTLTLLEKPGTTLLDLTLLLTDDEFRTNYLRTIRNPFLQKFWSTEFASMSQSRQAEVVSPILNKVGQFLSVPLIRNIVSQPQSGFSPRWVMDNNKVFLANLSKGKIGEDVSDMLGSLLVSKFQLDVMSRANIPEADRRPFRLYVDEFQNFATESFADILSESRKYGLELVIAHQYLGQVDKKLMESILGNVGTMVIFHTSHDDARILAPNISNSLTIAELTEQHNYEFVMKTTERNKKIVKKGELLSPDMLTPRKSLQDVQKLQGLVRDKYAQERSFVEGKLDKKVTS